MANTSPMSKRARWLNGSVLLLALSCQRAEEPVHKPTPPDMSELVAAYAEPTAELTSDNAAQVFDRVTALAEQLARLGLTQQLVDTIQTTLDERLEQTEAGSSSSELISSGSEPLGKLQQPASNGDAYLLVTRICGGFSDTPTPDRKANGAITLTVGLSGDRVDPVIWGAFHACKSRLSGVDVLLTGTDDAPGSFNAYAGEQLELGDFALSQLLFQLSLWAEVDGMGEAVDVDFQLDVQTLELDFRIPVDDGYVLAHADTSLLGVRATNGDFTCDALARRCDSGEQRVEF